MVNRHGSTSVIFVTIIAFWTLLTLFSYALDVHLTDSSIQDLKPDSTVDGKEEGIVKQAIGSILNVASDIPVVNVFVPLLRILTFQYTDVPVLVSIILDFIAILSGFVIASMLRGV